MTQLSFWKVILFLKRPLSLLVSQARPRILLTSFNHAEASKESRQLVLLTFRAQLWPEKSISPSILKSAEKFQWLPPRACSTRCSILSSCLAKLPQRRTQPPNSLLIPWKQSFWPSQNMSTTPLKRSIPIAKLLLTLSITNSQSISLLWERPCLSPKKLPWKLSSLTISMLRLWGLARWNTAQLPLLRATSPRRLLSYCSFSIMIPSKSVLMPLTRCLQETHWLLW